jgi:L-fucose mutarotase/ribose pyranase (RbsD/FucU family)
MEAPGMDAATLITVLTLSSGHTVHLTNASFPTHAMCTEWLEIEKRRVEKFMQAKIIPPDATARTWCEPHVKIAD